MKRRFTVSKDYFAGLGGDPNWAVYDARASPVDGDTWPIAAFASRAHAKMFADMMEDYEADKERRRAGAAARRRTARR